MENKSRVFRSRGPRYLLNVWYHREIHTSPFYKVSSMPLQLRVLREVQTPIANHWTSLYGMLLAGFAELESYPVGACTAGYILQKVGVQALLMAWTGMKHLLSAVFSYPSHPLVGPLRCARTRPPKSRDILSWNSCLSIKGSLKGLVPAHLQRRVGNGHFSSKIRSLQGPAGSRGATMKSSHKRDVRAPFLSTSSLYDIYLQRCRQRKHFVAETL